MKSAVYLCLVTVNRKSRMMVAKTRRRVAARAATTPLDLEKYVRSGAGQANKEITAPSPL